MSVSFRIDKEDGLLIWEMDGHVRPGDVLIAIGEVGRHPDFDRTYDELIVFGPSTQLNAFDARTLQETQTKIKAAYGDAAVRNVRSAVVCAGEHAALVTKLWRALAMSDESVGLDIKIFRDVGSACAWLGRPNATRREAG